MRLERTVPRRLKIRTDAFRAGSPRLAAWHGALRAYADFRPPRLVLHAVVLGIVLIAVTVVGR
ncbi:MAG TPA: hypothetical protein VEZ14_01645 [Dehalococcoidia bacterium]|nr:hypothetical protein [Dehalococcoidia bacterium]